MLLGGMLKSLDRYLGRGSYYWLKDRIHPQREYTQLTYARLIDEVLTPQTRWLDAGGGHQILEVATPTWNSRWCDGSGWRCAAIASSTLSRSIAAFALASAPRSTIFRFAAESLDLITLNNVAEHLEHPREVLAEFARVLAPGGRVIIHTPNVSSYAVRIAELGRRVLPEPFVMKLIRYMDFREEEDVFPTYYRANTCADLSAAAGDAGLSSEKMLLAPARPLFYFIAPLCAAELAASRLLIRAGRGAVRRERDLGGVSKAALSDQPSFSQSENFGPRIARRRMTPISWNPTW